MVHREVSKEQRRRHNKFERMGPATGSEAYEGANARSGRAGTIGLMIKSYKTRAGVPKRIFGDLGGAQLPQAPPVRTPLQRRVVLF